MKRKNSKNQKNIFAETKFEIEKTEKFQENIRQRIETKKNSKNQKNCKNKKFNAPKIKIFQEYFQKSPEIVSKKQKIKIVKPVIQNPKTKTFKKNRKIILRTEKLKK